MFTLFVCLCMNHCFWTELSVCYSKYSLWPIFGYFSTVMLVDFSCATTSANFRSFFCAWYFLYIHLLTYPYQKSFLKKISFEGFHNFVCTELSRAVVHGLCMYIENPKYRECKGAFNNYTWTELCHFLPPPPGPLRGQFL